MTEGCSIACPCPASSLLSRDPLSRLSSITPTFFKKQNSPKAHSPSSSCNSLFLLFCLGIPVSQQHLIWNNTELKDDYCLNDYK